MTHHLLHVASEPRGSATGRRPEHAADYLDFESADGFWRKTVPKALESGPVGVHFQGGDYARGPLRLQGLGSAAHPLVLHGASDGSTVFHMLPGDNEPKSSILARNCTNLVLRGLRFTGAGEVGYVLLFRGGCQRIAVVECVWDDLPNVEYGATGAHYSTSSHIAYRDCSFRRVGTSAGAHMMYHAYDSHHITVVRCRFEDCSGDYVRFRDNVDHCSVVDCAFRSTGTYPSGLPASRPFVAMPVFNDCEPGSEGCPDPVSHSQYEYFGTHYVFARNRFVYESHPGEGRPYAVAFYHQGFDPPGRRHLLTAAEGDLLERGGSNDRRALLERTCGMIMDRIRVYDNRYSGVERTVAFGSRAAYGALSRGWEGFANIEDLVNTDPPAAPARWLEPLLTLAVAPGQHTESNCAV